MKMRLLRKKLFGLLLVLFLATISFFLSFGDQAVFAENSVKVEFSDTMECPISEQVQVVQGLEKRIVCAASGRCNNGRDGVCGTEETANNLGTPCTLSSGDEGTQCECTRNGTS